MSTKENRQVAHEEIDYIFRDLLPGRGLPPRPEQIVLSHRMLDAMLDGQIALCDTGRPALARPWPICERL